MFSLVFVKRSFANMRCKNLSFELVFSRLLSTISAKHAIRSRNLKDRKLQKEIEN